MSATCTKQYFLSYSRSDEQFALRLASDLIAGGVSLWVDQYDIRASQHWDSAVEAAVRNCGGMLVILSPRSVASSNVADEVAVAIDAGKRVIPILIERCVVPLRMTRMQLIDATADYDRALRRCLAELRQPPVAKPDPGEDALYREMPFAAMDRPAQAPDIAVVSPDASRRITHELTRYLGPIAAHLMRREANSAVSVEQLRSRLSLNINSETERAAFLQATSGL